MFHVLAMLWEEESHLSEAQREIKKAALDACKYQVKNQTEPSRKERQFSEKKGVDK